MMMNLKMQAKSPIGQAIRLAGLSVASLFLLSFSPSLAATPDRPPEFNAPAAGKFLLLDFYTPYCGTCRMMEPHVRDLTEKTQGKMNLERVDISQTPNRKYISAFDIQSTPTYVLFNPGGKAVYKMEDTISPVILEKNVLKQIRAAEVTAAPEKSGKSASSQ